MKLISVSGMRESGKTTLIRELVSRLSRETKRSAVIVNDEGETAYDESFVRSHDLEVQYLRGG